MRATGKTLTKAPGEAGRLADGVERREPEENRKERPDDDDEPLDRELGEHLPDKVRRELQNVVRVRQAG